MATQNGSNFGTQSATVTTEHTLATVSSAADLVLYVNTTNMVLADELILRVKTKVLTGGTSVLLWSGRYTNVQLAPIKASIPVLSLFETIFTLEQAAGTSRNFEWSVVEPG